MNQGGPTIQEIAAATQVLRAAAEWAGAANSMQGVENAHFTSTPLNPDAPEWYPEGFTGMTDAQVVAAANSFKTAEVNVEATEVLSGILAGMRQAAAEAVERENHMSPRGSLIMSPRVSLASMSHGGVQGGVSDDDEDDVFDWLDRKRPAARPRRNTEPIDQLTETLARFNSSDEGDIYIMNHEEEAEEAGQPRQSFCIATPDSYRSRSPAPAAAAETAPNGTAEAPHTPRTFRRPRTFSASDGDDESLPRSQFGTPERQGAAFADLQEMQRVSPQTPAFGTGSPVAWSPNLANIHYMSPPPAMSADQVAEVGDVLAGCLTASKTIAQDDATAWWALSSTPRQGSPDDDLKKPGSPEKRRWHEYDLREMDGEVGEEQPKKEQPKSAIQDEANDDELSRKVQLMLNVTENEVLSGQGEARVAAVPMSPRAESSVVAAQKVPAPQFLPEGLPILFGQVGTLALESPGYRSIVTLPPVRKPVDEHVRNPSVVNPRLGVTASGSLSGKLQVGLLTTKSDSSAPQPTTSTSSASARPDDDDMGSASTAKPMSDVRSVMLDSQQQPSAPLSVDDLLGAKKNAIVSRGYVPRTRRDDKTAAWKEGLAYCLESWKQK